MPYEVQTSGPHGHVVLTLEPKRSEVEEKGFASAFPCPELAWQARTLEVFGSRGVRALE